MKPEARIAVTTDAKKMPSDLPRKSTALFQPMIAAIGPSTSTLRMFA